MRVVTCAKMAAWEIVKFCDISFYLKEHLVTHLPSINRPTYWSKLMGKCLRYAHGPIIGHPWPYYRITCFWKFLIYYTTVCSISSLDVEINLYDIHIMVTRFILSVIFNLVKHATIHFNNFMCIHTTIMRPLNVKMCVFFWWDSLL